MNTIYKIVKSEKLNIDTFLLTVESEKIAKNPDLVRLFILNAVMEQKHI